MSSAHPILARAIAVATRRMPDPVFPTYIAVQLQKALEQHAPAGGPRLVVDSIDGSANCPPVIAHVRDAHNGQRYRITVEVL